MLSITPIYAGLITLLFVGLSFDVIRHRQRARVSIGNGKDEGLAMAIRTHGNCAEYAPMALLLMAMTELQGAAGWVLHLLGIALLAGRLLHAYGLSRTGQTALPRQAGMILTFTVLVIAALSNLILVF